MTNQAKNYKITIFGEQYTFVSDESDQHVAFIAHVVDSYMQDIVKKMPRMPAQKVAVFVALQLASQLTHEQESNKHYSSQCELLTKQVATILDAQG